MKRFYKEVTTEKTDKGWQILLDGKPIKTPLKNDLLIANEKWANAVKLEWDEVIEEINPLKMPMTAYANVLCDKFPTNRIEMENLLVAYIEHDGLCYFAGEADEELDVWQEENFIPFIEAFNETYEIELEIATGIIAVEQDKSTIYFAKDYVKALSDEWLIFFYQLVTLSGSFILAVKIIDGFDSEIAWEWSNIEENMNIKRYGLDYEQEDKRKLKKQQWDDAFRYAELLRG